MTPELAAKLVANLIDAVLSKDRNVVNGNDIQTKMLLLELVDSRLALCSCLSWQLSNGRHSDIVNIGTIVQPTAVLERQTMQWLIRRGIKGVLNFIKVDEL